MTSRLLIPALTAIAMLTVPALAQTASANTIAPMAHGAMSKTAHQGLYRRAQLKLKGMGDYAGPVDGKRHASYVRALEKFQTAHHLRATGRLTHKTQRALGI